MRPVEPGARKQFHRAAVEARVHTVAVEVDFVEPLIAFRRRVDTPPPFCLAVNRFFNGGAPPSSKSAPA